MSEISDESGMELVFVRMHLHELFLVGLCIVSLISFVVLRGTFVDMMDASEALLFSFGLASCLVGIFGSVFVISETKSTLFLWVAIFCAFMLTFFLVSFGPHL